MYILGAALWILTGFYSTIWRVGRGDWYLPFRRMMALSLLGPFGIVPTLMFRPDKSQ
jgi:hypothetical protein